MSNITYRDRVQEPIWCEILPKREEVVNKDRSALAHRRDEYVFYNYTGVPLIIVDRDGEETTIEPTAPPELGRGIFADPVFKVVKVKYYSRSALNQARFPGVDDIEGKFGEIAKIYRDRVQEERNRVGTMTDNSIKLIHYEYHTTLESIRENDGAAYFEQIDLVIRTQESAIAYHPHSTMGKYHTLIHASKKQVEKPILGITIVDNSGMIGTRWIRMCGFVYRVEPVYTAGMADGVYLDGHSEAIHDGASSKRVLPDTVNFYPAGDPRIESALGLYPTEREAILMMCEKDIVAQEEQLKIEQERTRRAAMQAEWDKEARDHTMKIRQSEADTAAFKEASIKSAAERLAEKDARDAEAAAAKAAEALEKHNRDKQYDQDTHNLAMQREWLKFIPAVIGLITVVITTVATIMQLRRAPAGLVKLAGLF